MEFKTLPTWYPGEPRLRELARQFHDRGEETLYRLFDGLFAGDIFSSSVLLHALERPADFDLIDAPEPPPVRRQP